jgi:putative Holliday junction resolvase
LGVDVGSKRVGIARGSSAARIAQPLKVLPAEAAIEAIRVLAAKADGIVVGLPRGLDGQETSQTEQVRHWVGRAKLAIDKPFYWQDEALTSVAAKNKGALTGEVDAHAASVILQDFLDTSASLRVRC